MASYTPPRKSVSVNTNGAQGYASAGSTGGAKYTRKAASAVGKDAYMRKSAGISPSSQPVNDKDAGNSSKR